MAYMSFSVKKVLLVVCWLWVAGLTQAEPVFVHRDGRQLKDSTGKTLYLRGVNLGGWLMWEQWIWGGKFKSQAYIENNLQRLAGKTATQQFNEEIFRTYITEEDIRQIALHGFNVVRIPFNHRLLDTLAEAEQYKGIGWEILDQTLAWCKKYGVYAILDLHGAPGGQSPYFISDPEKPNLWKSTDAKNKTVVLWKALAKRYRHHTRIAGYDLLNEPIPDKDTELLGLYLQAITAIREVDTQHLLILEGSAFASKFEFFTQLPDTNMAFSFHVYTWFGGDPLKKIKKHVELSRQLNVPMWCGEWGENKYEVIERTVKALDDPAAGFAGWCFWTWKKAIVPGKFPALNGVRTSAAWKTLINNTSKPLQKLKLTTQQVQTAMMDFAHAAVYQQCEHDETLMKLLTDFAK